MDPYIRRLLRETHTEFADLIARPERKIDVAEGALLISRDAYPGLDIRAWLARLDQMADRVLGQLAAPSPPGPPTLGGDWGEAEARARLDALVEWFVAAGFRGNVADFYNPRNSYLNEVLERRLGIPITLGLVLTEVGRRVGAPLMMVGLPGHVVLGWAGPGEPFWLDPFQPQTRMTEGDCWRRVEEVYGRSLTWNPAWLAPLAPRLLLSRMLNNLRAIYLERGEVDRVMPVLEKMLLLTPGDTAIMRDLGLLHLEAGRVGLAARYLEPVLSKAPQMPDQAQVARRLRDALAKVAKTN